MQTFPHRTTIELWQPQQQRLPHQLELLAPHYLVLVVERQRDPVAIVMLPIDLGGVKWTQWLFPWTLRNWQS